MMVPWALPFPCYRQLLASACYRPVRPLCIIAFAEEEGTRFGKVCFGSQALTGKLKGLDPTA